MTKHPRGGEFIKNSKECMDEMIFKLDDSRIISVTKRAIERMELSND